MAGVSNATVAQIDEAQQVLGGRLASVQNQFSPRFRSSEGELEHCEKLGHRLHPLEPARRHRQHRRHRADPPRLRRRWRPRWGPRPQQVTLAWMLAKGSRVIPIPGSSRPETAVASAAAAELRSDAGAGGPARRLLSATGAEQNGGPACWTRCRTHAVTTHDGRQAAPMPATFRTGSEAAMPAVTVPDNLVLPRIPAAGDARRPPGQERHRRPVGPRGRGLPGPPRLRRRLDGRSRPLHPHGPDGRGRVRAGRAQGHARGTPTAASRP